MFKVLVEKELKSILQSPKFIATFLTISILTILSFYIGIIDYHDSVDRYNAAQSLVQENLQQASSWRALRTKVYREPSPLNIFVNGVNFDVGRYSTIDDMEAVNLESSFYSEEPIFAIFRILDFSFIVSIVFSLFAILFAYNAINGEKEEGTMRLVFSNSVSRAQFISAKFVGSWIGLVVPIVLPFLIGLLMLMLFNINLSGAEWLRVGLIFFASILYFTLFLGLGIWISAQTKRSSSSFLILLVIWIFTVFIIPRIGVMAAGQFVDVKNNAEIESINNSYAKSQWDEYFEKLENMWQQRESDTAGMTEAEKEAYEDENSFGWMNEQDSLKNILDENLKIYSKKLFEENSNRKKVLQKLAFSLTRLSPTSGYQLAVMNLAGSNIDVKNYYENSLIDYKDKFYDYVKKKEAENNNNAGMMEITISSESGFSINQGRDEGRMDLSELPQFQKPEQTLSSVFGASLIDLGILIFLTIVVYGLGYFSFLRYDPR